LSALLLKQEDFPAGYRLTAELQTEEQTEPAEPNSDSALDARSVEYTSDDGQRVYQATVFLNAGPDVAQRRVADLVPVEADTSDPHAIRMDTLTAFPDLGASAIATTHVVERGDEQAIVHMIAFAQGPITAILVLWDLSEELEIEDSIAVARRFAERVRVGLSSLNAN
jgi:hypothetical protein